MLACALVATGCGGQAQAKDGPAQVGITVGRDPTGTMPKIIAACNKGAKGKYVIEPIIMPPTVDATREQVIRRLAGKDPALDVVMLDVMWTGEFAEAKWVLDLSKRVEPIRDRYVPAALNTVHYEGKYWAVPARVETAFLYYRTDLVKTPPKSWEDMVRIAKKVTAQHPEMAGFLWQANQYEGLTVDSLEFIHAAGGSVLSDDYKTATLDKGDGAKFAFGFMQELVKSGVTPKSVTTFQEEESRQAFQEGKGVFLRNWPYVYRLGEQGNSKVKGKYDAIPLPPFEGREQASVLGGGNYAISRFSDAPEDAYDAIMCMTDHEASMQMLLARGEASSLRSVYEDPRAKKQVPWLDTMHESLENAYNRPNTPYYNDVTIALQRVAHEVVAGHISPADAVKRADASIQLAVDGEGEI